MQKFNVYVCRFGAIAMALISLNANADPVLVDVRSVDPTITVDLRYAGRNNFLRHSLYPRGTHALARPEIVSALAVAQSILRRYQYGLKIWDAYRPVAVQAMLWEASHNVIMLPIPKSARARCIVGVSPSTPPWSTHGLATSACQRTLTILLPLQCCLTWVRLWKYAETCVCCGTLCTRLVFAAYALNGGISRSLVGKNTCRLKKQRVPHKLLETHEEGGL